MMEDEEEEEELYTPFGSPTESDTIEQTWPVVRELAASCSHTHAAATPPHPTRGHWPSPAKSRMSRDTRLTCCDRVSSG